MNRPSVEDRIARGLCAVWERQARYVAGGTVDRIDGLLVAMTNLPDQTLNVALVEREPRDPERALAGAAEIFGRAGQHLGLDIPAGRYPRVEQAADGLGMFPIVSRPAMAVGLDALSAAAGVRGVTFERVSDQASLAAAVGIEVRVFGMARSVAERFVPLAALGEPGFSLYLAWADGEAAGTAAAHADHGAVGVFGVATEDRFRGRGIGTAITSFAVRDSAVNAGVPVDLAWLQATPQGRPMYERMGFRRAGTWVVWTGVS